MDTDGCCGSSAPPESNETLSRGPAKHINPETHLGLEQIALDQGKAIGLGNDRHDVDDLAKLLHDNDVDRAQRVARRVDEVQAAVDTCVLDVAVTHGSQLLAQVRAVLVLDVLDDRVPATCVCRLSVIGTSQHNVETYQPSLLIWSPYPGVSTMLRRSLTPFSTITAVERL